MSKILEVFNGDCLEVLQAIGDNSIDSLVTDPPAGISFMGKEWDDDKGGRKQWIAWMTEVMTECLRVLKPGAHGLIWAIPRTSHWTATALEDAGFEVRDVVTHLFGTGFPKSMDISKAIDKAAGATDNAKQWQGWGTALKPASEHWILVRKPCSEKTVAANVLKWGTGGINIDESRIEIHPNDPNHRPNGSVDLKDGGKTSMFKMGGRNPAYGGNTLAPNGRFPANLVLDEEAAKALDEQSSSNSSRFFYASKASKKDKGEGNAHPTVKSTQLMEYLITLITPPNGIVLDPFTGSGSTGVAANNKDFSFIGIEKEPEYYEIAQKRLSDRKIV